MNTFLVVGYGNPLRGDDGVGWRVAEAVAAVLPDPSVSVLAVHQLTPELAEPISRAEVVVFVDAAAEGEPGAVNSFALEDTGRRPVPQPLGSHLTTPGALLAMAAELYGHRPAAHMMTVAGASFEIGEELSPVVAAAVDEACRCVLRLLTDAAQHDGV